MSYLKVHHIGVLASLVWLGGSAAWAQSAGTAALTGTVTDPTGAVIGSANVTVINTDTNLTRTATTGGDGTYKFTLLPPGSYRVRFAASGFKTSEVGPVTLNVTETPVLDQKLEVGQATEQVTVEANAQILQTAESTLGRVVDGATISNQPLATRNFTSIMGLEAGAAGTVNNATTLGKATADVAVNGAGLDQNNIQMDGATIVNAFGAGNNADSGIYVGVPIPNPDTIQEFKVQTSTYDASYGRNPGANVNIVTKSGTNALHGSLFEFFRNEDLNANSFFYNRDNPLSSKRRQILKQNQFGGTIGGPIKKDKLFFFGSYQGTRQRNGVSGGGTASPVLPPIPAGDRSTAAFRAALGAAMCPANHPGNPAYLTGFGNPNEEEIACDGSNISQTALNILNVKLPNGQYYVPGSTNGGFQQANYSIPSIYTGDQYLANVDWLVNAKNTLAMRYFFTEDPQTTPFSISNIPGTPASSYYANTVSRVKLTTLVTPSLVNEVRASLERNIANGSDSTPYTNQQVGITGIVPQETQPPVMVLVGAFNLGGTLSPFYGPANQIQYADQISWSHGRHTLRAGFEYEFAQWNLSFASLLRGFLFSPGFNDFLLGKPGGPASSGGSGGLGTWFQCLFCVRSGPNGIIHGYREHNMSWYVQDDWKVNSNLTLNMGLRWEYDGVFGDAYGNLTNVWPSLMTGVAPQAAPAASGAGLIGYVVPHNFLSHYPAPPAGVTVLSDDFPSKNGVPLSDFGPRIGFAWQPKVNGRLVVRGGFGIFYDRVGSSKFVHSVEQGMPYALTLDYAGGASIPYSLANPFPSTPLGFVSRWFNPATGANSSLNTPFYETVHAPLSRQFNLGFQYQLAGTWVLEAAYVGSSGINQANYNHNINLAQLASPAHPINGQTTNTLANAVYRVPYLGYQEIGLQATAYDAVYNYNSLQVTLRKRFAHGFTMQAAYTWSKDLSDLSYGDRPGEGQTNLNDANRIGTQYAPVPFSHPHRFVASYAYDLPFGGRTGALGRLVGGWNISGNVIAQTGSPLTVTDTAAGTAYYGAANPGSPEGGSATAQLAPGITSWSQLATSGGVESRLGGASGGPGFINKSAFTNPIVISSDGATLFGNSGIGVFRGPDEVNFDVSVIKNTKLTERQNLQFRSEFFNIANHPIFGNPTAARNNANLFGVINSTIGNPRLIQFALKYSF